MMVELKLNPLLSLSDTFNAIKFGENNKQATQQDNLHSKDNIACNRTLHYKTTNSMLNCSSDIFREWFSRLLRDHYPY